MPDIAMIATKSAARTALLDEECWMHVDEAWDIVGFTGPSYKEAPRVDMDAAVYVGSYYVGLIVDMPAKYGLDGYVGILLPNDSTLVYAPTADEAAKVASHLHAGGHFR